VETAAGPSLETAVPPDLGAEQPPEHSDFEEDDQPTVVGDAATIARELEAARSASGPGAEPPAATGETTSDDPAGGRSNVAVVAAVLAVLGVGGLLVGGVLVSGAFWYLNQGEVAAVEPTPEVVHAVQDHQAEAAGEEADQAPEAVDEGVPAEAEPPSPSEAAEAPVPVPEVDAAAGEAEALLSFTSAVEDTRKIQVRCAGGSISGAQTVEVDFQPGAQCTVTVLTAGRKRFTAVVSPVDIRPYTCFEGGSGECG